MGFQLDRWNRTPASPLMLVHGDSGRKFLIGPLKDGKRSVEVVTSETVGLWKTRRNARLIGYWDVATDEFVSTDALLHRTLFMAARVVILDLANLIGDDVVKGTVDFCPVCSRHRDGSGITREIGLMLRFFKKPRSKELE
jgi:kynurenine formamidase